VVIAADEVQHGDHQQAHRLREIDELLGDGVFEDGIGITHVVVRDPGPVGRVVLFQYHRRVRDRDRLARS
jgi:hypothetical protein